MSIQPDHALLDVLRASLHKAETDPRPATPASDELKRLLRKRSQSSSPFRSYWSLDDATRLVLDTDAPVLWSAPESGCRVLAVFAK